MRRSPRKAKAKERPLPTYGADSRSDGVHSRAHGAMSSILDAMDSDSDGGVDSDDDVDDTDDDTDTDMGSDDSESSDNDSTTGYVGPACRLEERLAGRMVWRRRVGKSDDKSEDSNDEGISSGPGFFLGTFGGPGLVGMRTAVGQSSHQQCVEDEGPRKRRRTEDGYAAGPPLDKDQPAPNAVNIPDFGALLLESCKTSHPLHVLDLVPNAPSADHIWLASCATAEGLPSVPDDIPLGEFVRLVYKKGCRFCDACNIQKIHWAARVRTCKRCFSNRRHFVDEATALADLKEVRGAWTGSLIRLLPPVVMGKSRKALLSPLYMTLSIDELIDDYERDGVKRMSRGEQKAWYKRKRRAMEGVFEHAKICEQWDKERDENVIMKAEENKRERKAEIHRRLTDMGYGLLLQEPGVASTRRWTRCRR
ncbi:uncharacterized protein SCHCODRAFT_02608831 [Schizophyllum commune H4-8]|uniref:uncharacterized protein n=1 Tax=Schizophyllum commune (strain H4-8 / FGSC 9210) TaxID=578458 RepID=UPI002160458F|nr:uncharacterized protein SCHCODRAFT_02608831 [Schizophyllum commune H4-8]KAI5900805.1 hypothetical protein SCHCODRAFT_02608831 [Schizophyllum commune H4-8]